MTTKDGYILKLFRVYPNWNYESLKYRPVVLLQHGLLSSSEVFVMNKELSLAALLARDGYDVWLLNSRGSIYSRGH